jgi:hypothetical protein
LTFAGMNYLAIVIAAVAAWLFGAGWYMALGKPWMAALGTTPDKMAEAKRRPGAWLPFVYCWVGFVITTMVVNNGFAGRDARLLLIDGGQGLIVLLLMGAIIGGMGP